MICLQVGGRTIVRYPAILRLIKDELPRYLFSLVFSLEPRNSLVSERRIRGGGLGGVEVEGFPSC